MIFLIIGSLSKSLKDQAIDINDKVTETVYNYINKQCQKFKSNQDSIYYKENMLYNNGTGQIAFWIC